MSRWDAHAVMSGGDRSLGAKLARAGACAAEPGYRAGAAARNRLFDWGLRKAARLGRPTVSIGNITAGGTGKTPMVIETVRRLRAGGERPGVLLRGYGGDEAVELQRRLPADAAVEANADRAAGAAALLGREPGVSVFVLDDGFQHRQAHRDLDVVLVDATNPFGYEHVLPRGLLREAPSGLGRADAIVITRADQVGAEELEAVRRRVEQAAGQAVTALAGARWEALVDQAGRELAVEALGQHSVMGVCGIGNPGVFGRMLGEAAGRVVEAVELADHQAYTAERIERLMRQAEAAGADWVVTTEKDWVKWERTARAGALRLPVVRPRLGVWFVEGEQAFETRLRAAVSR